MSRPTIGITMGDAAGVGPEIIAKALGHRAYYAACRPLVIGDASILQRAMTIVGSTQTLRAVTDADRWEPDAAFLDVVDLGLLAPESVPFGAISPQAGDAAFRYLERANRLALDGAIDAVCTAPLNKEALHAGGHRFPGHTEILAELSHTAEFAMMLTAPNLRVIHVTTHIGLLDAIARITPERVHTVIRLAHETLVRAGIPSPRIGVCGINPHAGEHGLFGRGEEEKQIEPAVARARAEGIAVDGPLPADTLFFRAVRGDFDIVVAMYHDQGHGPIKVMGLEAGVNITVGLPYIRTSVDHGTAFDIAGTGRADDGSMRAALDAAIALAPKRAVVLERDGKIG
ncbi:4-hydroxythreonine-4-phosphate dehydrogenase [Vulcanimicrobium alpinum]|uniref:4-hydroxythreonine-4-phosphate dehydrogenase n=1 Tax=Vulcanimicrobium alpinum TaxID=3016050 RepID=A0AAN2CA56_UNVUL|nr:4-hydroxythreonine-4-phosphate dehydrogenase PdxA [Vulcanimicrobium alpinum]BDE06312.1 4-hydroxythreonine-4-phosphate dehydrogenase [Vulcanimicrobium alpinum]